MGLERFLSAQDGGVYHQALAEIKCGKKQSHWMWFIFPQLIGLGHSENARYFSIGGLAEACSYLEHPVLGKHLVEIARALLQVKGKTVYEIFGSPDDMKLHSCMTLFTAAANTNPVFSQVLEKYFDGRPDSLTLTLLSKNP